MGEITATRQVTMLVRLNICSTMNVMEPVSGTVSTVTRVRVFLLPVARNVRSQGRRKAAFGVPVMRRANPSLEVKRFGESTKE